MTPNIYRANGSWSEIAIGIFALTLLALWLIVSAPSASILLTDPDLGNQLSKGLAILAGKHPFADYPIGAYGPLVFYLSAMGQAVSGAAGGELIINLTGYFIGYALLWYLTKRITRNQFFALFILIMAVGLAPRFYKYYVVTLPLAHLLALHLTVGKADRRDVWILGASTALVGLFRIDFGFYALIATLVLFFLSPTIKFRRSLPAYLLTALIVVAPWLLFLIANGDVFEVIFQIVSLSAGLATGLGLPAPGTGDLLSGDPKFVSFFVVFWLAAALPWAGAIVSFLKETGKTRAAHVAMHVFSGLIFLQAAHRSDIGHLLQVLPCTLISLSLLVSRFVTTGRWFGVVAASLSFGAVALPIMDFQPGLRALSRGSDAFSHLPPWNLNKDELLDHLSRTRAGEKNAWMLEVLSMARGSANGKNFMFLPYYPQFYFLADKTFVGKFDSVHPGNRHSLPSEEEFASLNYSYIVDVPPFSFDNDPSRNLRWYAPEFARAIYEQNEVVAVFWPAVVLSRPASDTRKVQFINSNPLIHLATLHSGSTDSVVVKGDTLVLTLTAASSTGVKVMTQTGDVLDLPKVVESPVKGAFLDESVVAIQIDISALTNGTYTVVSDQGNF